MWYECGIYVARYVRIFMSGCRASRPLPSFLERIISPAADGKLNITDPWTLIAPAVDPAAGYRIINEYNPIVYLGERPRTAASGAIAGDSLWPKHRSIYEISLFRFSEECVKLLFFMFPVNRASRVKSFFFPFFPLFDSNPPHLTRPKVDASEVGSSPNSRNRAEMVRPLA